MSPEPRDSAWSPHDIEGLSYHFPPCDRCPPSGWTGVASFDRKTIKELGIFDRCIEDDELAQLEGWLADQAPPPRWRRVLAWFRP